MFRLILGALVIAHGVLTAVIWVVPAGKDAPFDASHSWLIGDARAFSVIAGLLVGASFVVTGVGVLTHAAWWPTMAVIAGLGGAMLMIVWFNVWLLLGLAISLAIFVAGYRRMGA